MSRIQSHTSDLAPGAVVNRDFAIEIVVGRGAFSTVYRAVQRSRKDRPVAVKVLHRGIQNLIEQEAGRVRNPYMKEQLLCQRLKDPAVCRVVKVGTTEDGRYFVALEWAAGVTLEDASPAFAAPAGYVADPDRLDVHQRALAYQSKHPNTDYLTAVRAVGGA